MPERITTTGEITSTAMLAAKAKCSRFIQVPLRDRTEPFSVLLLRRVSEEKAWRPGEYF
jgi:hypothetical protein